MVFPEMAVGQMKSGVHPQSCGRDLRREKHAALSHGNDSGDLLVRVVEGKAIGVDGPVTSIGPAAMFL
jgi:hypothetical protein